MASTVVSNTGSKRAQPARGSTAKKQKQIQELEEIAKSDNEAEQNAEIMAIMVELVRTPSKIKRVKVACFGASAGDISAEERKLHFFHATYIYLPRVPATWLKEELFPLFNEALTVRVVTMMAKKDGEVVTKILYMGTGSHEKQKLMSHNKATFKDLSLQRHAAMNNVLTSLTWEEDYTIDWKLKNGLFFLSPEVPEDCHPKDHVFTHIHCRALEGEESKAQLPEHLSKVSGEWRFEENWMFTSKLVSPSHVRPRSVSPCSEFFDHLQAFKKLVLDMPVKQDEPSEDPQAAQQVAAAAADDIRPEDSASQVGGSSPAKSPAPAASPQMCAKTLQAALNKLRKNSA